MDAVIIGRPCRGLAPRGLSRYTAKEQCSRFALLGNAGRSNF